MSYYDDSSLFVAPNGYKTSVLFAQKPMDANGQLAFTRSNDTATRVGPDGLIEKVRTNLLLYSEQFDNAYWNKNAITATADATTSPEGNADADKLTPSTASAGHFVSRSITGNVQTASIFAKADEYSHIALFYTVHDGRAVFDLSTGTIAETTGTVTAEIEDFGNGWYRCILSTTLTTQNQIRYYVINGTSWADFSVAGDGTSGVFLWGAQLETGDIATDYIPTTTAAVSVGPVANLPRIDYTGGGCGKLLLEPQRTNSLFYSEQFDNAYWSKSNATISANTLDTLDPSGYYGADKLTDNATLAGHVVFRLSTWDTTQRTASVYAKAGTSSKVTIQNGSLGTGVFADLSAGTIVVSSGFTGTITEVGNGWYRITATHTAASAQLLAIGLFTGTSTTAYVGTGSFAYIWGAMLEQGSYSTSYINTLGSASTRGADSCSKTGISSLIGQTEGTIFVDFQLDQAPSDLNGRLLQLWATSDTTNSIIPIINQNLQLQITTFASGVGAPIIPAGPSTLLGLGRNKIAVAYTSTSIVVYRNGVLFASGNPTGYFPTSLTSLDLGGSSSAARNLGNPINQALLFKTRLSNSELAQLTTI